MRRLQQGSTFIFSVVMVALLTLLVVSAAGRIRTEASSQRTRLEGLRAERMTDAGLARALASLQTLDPNAATTTTDEWLELGQTGGEEFTVAADRFRVQVVDAGSLVNLNTAPEEHLLNLPISQEQVDSLLDWREAGQTPRPQGAKDEFYNNLTRPYNAAARRLNTFDELLAVRGFDGPTLYDPPTGDRVRALSTGQAASQAALNTLSTVDSESANLGPDGNQRLNVNAVGVGPLVGRGIRFQAANAIVNRRNAQGTFTTMRQVLEVPGLNQQDFAPILDNLSVSAQATLTGRINLNTAEEEVLRTVPGLPDEAVQQIVSRRGTFATLGELASLPGVSATNLPQLADTFTVTNSVFLVRVMGESGSRKVFLEAVVRFQEGLPRLVRRETPPFADMDQRWGWPEEPTQTTEIVSAP